MEKICRRTNFVFQIIFASITFIGLLYGVVSYTSMAVSMISELHTSVTELTDETLASFLLGGVGIFEISTSFVMLIFLLCTTVLLFVFAITSYGFYSRKHMLFMSTLSVLYCLFALLQCAILFSLNSLTRICAVYGLLTVFFTVFNLIIIRKEGKEKLTAEREEALKKAQQATTSKTGKK